MRARVLLPTCLCLMLACVPVHALAQSAGNSYLTLSIFGSDRIQIAPGETARDVFPVRVVDTNGAPLPGVVVEYTVDGACDGLPLQPDPCPPPQVYGHFPPVDVGYRVVVDADGRATADEFFAGTVAGVYSVRACALNAENGIYPCVSFIIHQVELGATVPITPGFTGAWYDPGQSGHGLLLEVLPESRLLAYWFAFDPDGRQSWFGGVGAIDADIAIIYADTGAGGAWIPNFDPSQYARLPWGTLMFQFSDCNHGRVDFTGTYAGTAYGSGHMDLTRLTQPAGVSCN